MFSCIINKIAFFLLEFSVDGVEAKKGDSISITASKPVFLTVAVLNSSGKNENQQLIYTKKTNQY